MRIVFLLLTILTALAGCTGYVQKAGYNPAREMPDDAASVPIVFRGVEFLLPVGADVGFESTGARFCGWPRYPVSRTALRNVVDHKFLGQTFHDALEAQGYDVVGSLGLAYDIEDEMDRAEYSVSAKIRDVQMEICHKEPDNFMIFFTTRRGDEGEFYMDVDWTVYDALRRTVVYQTKTQGYTKRSVPNEEGLPLMFNDAFEMAAHNLGADEQFYNLLANGIKPENWRREKIGRGDDEADAARPRRFDPREEIVLKALPLSKEPFTKNIDAKRRAAVIVQKFGHGSGFFISRQGHILTNAHVVGDGLRTRIVTADNAHKLTAEVLRIDKPRDVALLRLEEIPEDLDIVALPLRLEWPAVGEDAYAIGVPQDARTMRDTVTKGIISAHRMAMKFQGTRQNFIQADVEVHQGSSGGPLLDADGNVTGITVGAYTDINNNGMGLNYFIPVGEALEALDLGPPVEAAAPLPLGN